LGDDLAALQAGSGRAKIGMRAEGFGMQVLEGARELVGLLSELEIPMAIVSGSSRAEIAEALDQLGFADRLNFWLGAEDYPRGKPAPDGYLHAAERLVVAPARTLVVEDSHAGIASALAAGMRVIATAAANPPSGTAGHQDQSRAHLRLPNLRGIDPTLLRRAMTEPA
jgi:beta-phosphoglucomutase-like phosphatase (HAD superfamily)